MSEDWPEWLADGLSWGTHCVGSYVPSGFERYLRLEHLRAFEGRYALYLSTLCEAYSTSIEELLDVSSRSDRYSRGWISPTLWFDDKRTWCIATPVYWPCSFIGCSTSLFEQLRQRPALRLVETTWNDEFTNG